MMMVMRSMVFQVEFVSSHCYRVSWSTLSYQQILQYRVQWRKAGVISNLSFALTSSIKMEPQGTEREQMKVNVGGWWAVVGGIRSKTRNSCCLN